MEEPKQKYSMNTRFNSKWCVERDIIWQITLSARLTMFCAEWGCMTLAMSDCVDIVGIACCITYI